MPECVNQWGQVDLWVYIWLFGLFFFHLFVLSYSDVLVICPIIFYYYPPVYFLRDRRVYSGWEGRSRGTERRGRRENLSQHILCEGENLFSIKEEEKKKKIVVNHLCVLIGQMHMERTQQG